MASTKITAIVYNPFFHLQTKKKKPHNIFTVIVLKIGDFSFPKIFKICVMCFVCHVMEMWLKRFHQLCTATYLPLKSGLNCHDFYNA